jgi:hypothetical protein
MKNSVIGKLILFVLSVVPGPMALMAQDALKIAIPFDFHVGAKAFASGDYTVCKVADHTLAIRNRNNGNSAMTVVASGDRNRNPGKSMLRFNRYGNQYFLSAVFGPSEGWVLPASTAEKELIARNGSSRSAVLQAALSKK